MMSLTVQPVYRWLFELAGAYGAPQTATTAGTPDDFELLTIASERHRVGILARIVSSLTALLTVFGVIAHTRGSLPQAYWPLLGLACLASIYQWAAWRYLVFAVERGIRPARFRFYLNALLELSVPTGMIWLASAYVQPGNAISGPASYIYFLFIILSALRLDFNLSVFTGAVVALAYTVTV